MSKLEAPGLGLGAVRRILTRMEGKHCVSFHGAFQAYDSTSVMTLSYSLSGANQNTTQVLELAAQLIFDLEQLSPL